MREEVEFPSGIESVERKKMREEEGEREVKEGHGKKGGMEVG